MTQARELLKCERCAVFLLALEEGGEEVNILQSPSCESVEPFASAEYRQTLFCSLALESLRSHLRTAREVDGGATTPVQERGKGTTDRIVGLQKFRRRQEDICHEHGRRDVRDGR